MKGPALYAFKGMAGRFAPIGVHLAMLLIMAGGTLSATGSFRGSVNVPQGLNFVVGDVMNPSGFLSNALESFNTEVHVNRFYMEYYESGEVTNFFSASSLILSSSTISLFSPLDYQTSMFNRQSNLIIMMHAQVSQFRTDISLLDLNGKEVMRKTISVNDPLRYGGITIYQTDWGFSALQVSKDGEGPFNLAMAPLQINGDKKLYGTILPVGDTNSPNVKGM